MIQSCLAVAVSLAAATGTTGTTGSIGPPGAAPDAEAAQRLMIDVSRAYSKATALTDDLKIHVRISEDSAVMMEDDSSCALRIDGNDAMCVGGLWGTNVHVINGTLYASIEGLTGAAVKVDLGDNPREAARAALGDMGDVVAPQLQLRWADDAPARLFAFGVLENPAYRSLTAITDADGKERLEVVVGGDGDSSARIHVDPDTRLIHAIRVAGTMPGGHGEMDLEITSKPRVVDRLDEAIAFDEGAVKTFPTFEAMLASSQPDMAEYAPTIAIGAAAPTFELIDQNGKTHTLESYAGQVVVMDWWGVW